MQFLSFAQNFEDVFVHRCFGARDTGIYIDVGASAPVKDSVTYASYLRGWRGLNIEPIPDRILELRRFRPRDVNILGAVGSRRRPETLYRTEGVGGLSTFERSYVDHLITAGRPVEEVTVAVCTLDEICLEHSIADVQFLKVDVEGREEEVLRGISFVRCRPELLIIEAIHPNSREDRSTSWLTHCKRNEYHEVYNDGLNKFLLRSESMHLKVHFTYPVNIFDGVTQFSMLGAPLDNLQHPDRDWAKRFANLNLRFAARLTDEAVAEILGLDIPQFAVERPLSLDDLNLIFDRVLGRWLAPPEASRICPRAQAGEMSTKSLMLELIGSDEFRDRLARACACS